MVLDSVPETFLHSHEFQKEQAYIWTSEALRGLFFFKAQFQRFVFKKHVHEEFGIGVIEQGTQKFEYQERNAFCPDASHDHRQPGHDS